MDGVWPSRRCIQGEPQRAVVHPAKAARGSIILFGKEMKRCLNCQSSELYISSETFTNAADGPHLVPKISIYLTSPRMKTIACVDCGRIELIVEEEARDKIKESSDWKKLNE